MNKPIKFYSKSKLIKISLLSLCIGGNIGLWAKTYFPGSISTRVFRVEGTAHIGQVVYKALGPKKVLMYNQEIRGFIPLEKYLKQIPKELGRRGIARKRIEDALNGKQPHYNRQKTKNYKRGKQRGI